MTKILTAWLALHKMARMFMAGVSSLLITWIFLLAVAVIVIPLGHHVWSYWHGIATSLQTSSIKAAEIRGRK